MVATSLVAPAAIASLTTTAVTTLQAAPASALPVRTFVVAGDAPTRTGLGSGAWGFHGADFSQLRGIITSSANFGPNGTVKTASFTIGDPIATISDQSLAGVDVFFSGAIEGSASFGYTVAEQQALQRFVARGGMLVLNVNSDTWNTASYLGVSVRTSAIYEANSSHEGAAIGGSGRYAAGNPDTNTAAPSIPVSTHPIIQGPFGNVASFQNWHTVTAFNEGSLPSGAQVLARLTYSCTPQASAKCQTTAPPTTTTGATTTTAAGPTTTTTPPVPDLPYNNSFSNAPTLALVQPVVSGFSRSGAIILTSDVDTFSNHATADDPSTPLQDETEVYANPMLAGNELLAKNTFAYIANQLSDGYTPLTTPVRVLSTRDGINAVPGAVAGGTTRTLKLTDANGIPAYATAVALNVTVTNPTAASFVSVYPEGQYAIGQTPATSNLNFNPGQTIANMVVVNLPSNGSGRLTFFNEQGNADILADVVGYFSPGSGDRFNPTTVPDRVLDTRGGNQLGAKAPRSVQITGAGQGFVPAGATAVVLNVTAVNNTAGGYLSVYPGDQVTVPNASNINFVPGKVIPNLVVARLSSSGSITIYNDAGTTDVLVDVLGYFVSGSGGGSFGAVNPSRILDTRTGVGAAAEMVGPRGSIELTVLGQGGVPATNVRTVLLNVTAAGPTAESFITVWPDGARTQTSNLNTTAGQNIPNLVLAKVGTDGKVRLYNDNGSVHLLADVVGYFS
jgi:hypothetical protein